MDKQEAVDFQDIPDKFREVSIREIEQLSKFLSYRKRVLSQLLSNGTLGELDDIVQRIQDRQ